MDLFLRKISAIVVRFCVFFPPPPEISIFIQ
jgi:hypothetical protein